MLLSRLLRFLRESGLLATGIRVISTPSHDAGYEGKARPASECESCCTSLITQRYFNPFNCYPMAMKGLRVVFSGFYHLWRSSTVPLNPIIAGRPSLCRFMKR